MKRAAAIAALAASLGAGAGAVVGGNSLRGTAYVRFGLQLPDGGTRDLGRTGCYDFSKVKATVEPCGSP